jgi:hypothetical protein
MFHHLIDGETWEVAPYTWKPMGKNLSMEGAISLQNRKVGSLHTQRQLWSCCNSGYFARIMNDCTHHWSQAICFVATFHYFVKLFRGKIGGFFLPHCNKCVFFEKKMSLLNFFKSLKRKPWDSRYKEFKIKLPNNHDIGHCALLPNY